jgi:hypothetical protein
MGGFLGDSSPPQRDDSADRARAEAEAKAKEESDALKAKQEEDEDAIRRGLRGRRSLLSSAGGELGFNNSLGG